MENTFSSTLFFHIDSHESRVALFTLIGVTLDGVQFGWSLLYARGQIDKIKYRKLMRTKGTANRIKNSDTQIFAHNMRYVGR